MGATTARPSLVEVAADDDLSVEWSEPLPDQLWVLPLRITLAGSTFLGGVLIAVGWVSASDTRIAGDQIGGLVTAVVGLGLAAVGQALWIMSGRRRLGRWLATVLPKPDPSGRDDDLDRAGSPDNGRLVAVQGGTGLYHRSACPFASGKPVIAGDRESHEKAGRSACAVCEP